MKSRWALAKGISDDAISATPDPSLLFQTTLEHLVQKMEHVLILSAISRYEYTCLDEKKSRLITQYEKRRLEYPQTLWSHFLISLADRSKTLGNSLAQKRLRRAARWLVEVSRWLRMHARMELLRYHIPIEDEIGVEDLLDGITLQIHYLHRHGIEPQAIIAHPEILDRFRVHESMSPFGVSTIFGLRVISEPTMKTLSAYVV